jgi:hypothetical protein
MISDTGLLTEVQQDILCGLCTAELFCLRSIDESQ